MNPGAQDAIAAINAVAPQAASGVAPGSLPAGAAGGAVQTSFSNLVSEGLSQVNTQLLASDAALTQLATGKAENLHQIMIQLEESRLSFQLLMQVRTRLLEAYQEVMRMQV